MLPLELVICDDGSTDGTRKIVAQFAAAAPFEVRWVANEERLGYRANFMKVAGLCRGALIGFCDQDDIWHPAKLATVAARFDDPGVMLVHHNSRLVTAAGEPFGRVRDWPGVADTDDGPMAASPWRFPQGFAMTFRAELLALSAYRARSLDYLTGEDPLAHDQWIYLLALVFGRVRFIAETLADYRQHDSNAYGITRAQKTRLDRLHEKLEKFSDYNRYATACTALAALLRDCVPGLPPTLGAARALAAADQFDELARLYRRRATVYAAASPLARAAAWRGLVRDGRYDPASGWSFDPKEKVRDALLGVCLAKLRRRTGRDPFRDWSLRPGVRP